MAYTQYGPFSNGSAPGVAAEFLNPLETFLGTVNSAATDSHISADGNGIFTILGLINNVAAVTVTGTTAGSATLYQFMRGSVKGYILYLNGYRNSTTTEQTISLPQAVTTRTFYLTSNPVLNVYKSGSKVNNGVAFVSTPASTGGGGSATVVTSTPAMSWGEISPSGGYDALGLGISQASPTTGLFFAIGL